MDEKKAAGIAACCRLFRLSLMHRLKCINFKWLAGLGAAADVGLDLHVFTSSLLVILLYTDFYKSQKLFYKKMQLRIDHPKRLVAPMGSTVDYPASITWHIHSNGPFGP